MDEKKKFSGKRTFFAIVAAVCFVAAGGTFMSGYTGDYFFLAAALWPGTLAMTVIAWFTMSMWGMTRRDHDNKHELGIRAVKQLLLAARAWARIAPHVPHPASAHAEHRRLVREAIELAGLLLITEEELMVQVLADTGRASKVDPLVLRDAVDELSSHGVWGFLGWPPEYEPSWKLALMSYVRGKSDWPAEEIERWEASKRAPAA